LKRHFGLELCRKTFALLFAHNLSLFWASYHLKPLSENRGPLQGLLVEQISEIFSTSSFHSRWFSGVEEVYGTVMEIRFREPNLQN
ncbi:hypothetical protein, partial [Chlorobium limicola]|uniref:hypothetical protein n=1 Tax=Chlorobium limicola TaxID=1092 RepID=UPI0023F2FA51